MSSMSSLRPSCSTRRGMRERLVTNGPIDALEDEDWLELTLLGAPAASADSDAEPEPRTPSPEGDDDVTTRAMPTAWADDAQSGVRGPAPSQPTTKRRSATPPGMLGRARTLLTDKLV